VSDDVLRYTPMVLLPVVLFLAVVLGLQTRSLRSSHDALADEVATLEGKVARMQQAGAARAVGAVPTPRPSKAKGKAKQGKGAKGGKARGSKGEKAKGGKAGKAKGAKAKGGKAGKAKGGKAKGGPRTPPPEEP